MSQFFKVSELEKLSTLTIYRMLLKNMKHYPSKNRFGILNAIQEEFHDHKSLPPNEIPKMRKKAEMGLRHVMYYIEKNKDLMANKYHNLDDIEPIATKKDQNIYF